MFDKKIETEEEDVFLIDTNIMYQLQTRPNFWGEKPTSTEVQDDLPIIIE